MVSLAGPAGRAVKGWTPRAMELAKLFASLPNLITLARLLLAPLAVLMIVSQRFMPAFAIFVVAGLSDAVDGFIAKRFDLRTELGAYLDPLADKALLVSIYVTLAIVHELPPAIAIIVVSRDLMILIAVLISWLLDNPVAIRPVWVSKFNTAAQIAVAALVLGVKAFGLQPLPGQEFAVWLVAASTIASGAVYIAQWLDHMNK
jgi:cardiolipin synthase (CMP-forming)